MTLGLDFLKPLVACCVKSLSNTNKHCAQLLCMVPCLRALLGECGLLTFQPQIEVGRMLCPFPTFVFVARSKQVYIEWMEATVLSIYLPEEKRTFICTFDLPFCLRLPCCLRPPFPGTCPADPSCPALAVCATCYPS